MAIITPIHGQMSGSIGDNTFSHNKGGPYVRRRAIPTLSTSAKLAYTKALLSSISGSWNALTDNQRQQWNAWAGINTVINALGQSIILSGQQAFVGLNARGQAAGFTATTVPPTGDGPAALLTLVVTPAAPATLSCAFTPALPTGYRIAIWQSLPSTLGRNPNFNQARLVGYSAASQATPFVATTPYILSTGNVINVWGCVIDPQGRTSPPIKARVTVP